MAGNLKCCAWSKFNGGCGVPCDFKKLKYDKDAIVERLKKEAKWTQDMKQKIGKAVSAEEAEKMFAEMADKIVGMKIMVSRLKEDFGMDEVAVKQIMKGEVRHDVITDAKMVIELTKLKMKRAKK